MGKHTWWAILFGTCVSNDLNAQDKNSLLKDSGWSVHFQFTAISQGHPAFHADYSGKNSLQPEKESALSVTSTLYLGRKLWKGASVFLNPEISGGRGISSALGIAGFTNGETFRIGDADPKFYVGRIYLQQHIALNGSETEDAASDMNQVTEKIPSKRITIRAGKFGMADFFDNNNVSHDPRMDFMNWGLMNNGAYDYAANTRGYTLGIVVEYATPSFSLRGGTALMPTYANGPKLDDHYNKTNSETLEFEKRFQFGSKKGTLRALAYYNVSKAPLYDEVVASKLDGRDTSMDVIFGKKYGGKKFGWGLNGEQELSSSTQVFFRLGWNDGKTATWAFTEIDNTASAGVRIHGKNWGRPSDNIGLALLTNGISSHHRNFLNNGGYGFLIGDGKLENYGRENITELFYELRLSENYWVTGDYQFVLHPAYNKARGPVHVFSLRGHVEF